MEFDEPARAAKSFICLLPAISFYLCHTLAITVAIHMSKYSSCQRHKRYPLDQGTQDS